MDSASARGVIHAKEKHISRQSLICFEDYFASKFFFCDTVIFVELHPNFFSGGRFLGRISLKPLQ
jgi:hypothetical protein